MQDLIERLEALFATGDLEQAFALVRSYEAADPARYELGMVALANASRCPARPVRRQ